MRIPLLILSSLLLAGCVTPAVEDPPVDAAGTPITDVVTPVVQEFLGRMTASPLGPLAHQNADLELMIADVQREGFLLEIVTVPQILQLDLEWTSPSPAASMILMVNIPTSTDGKVVDVFSERSDTGALCMRLNPADLAAGPVSVMAHSSNAVALDYVVRITNIDGEVLLHADRGHMEVERADAEERDALPCEETSA